MKAFLAEKLALVESRPGRVAEVDDPVPGPREVRIRVRFCAVCRTDLHVIEGDLPRARLPIIPGHQAVGTVDMLGPGCRRLRIGQRVGVPWLRSTCGRCRYCTGGRENLCPDARFTGYHEHGGFAQYALIHEDFAYEPPPSLDDAHAAPLLCAGIIGYRALQRSNPFPGCRLALIGFGSSAHIVAQLARHRGYEVYITARSAAHRDWGLRMGARWAGEHPDQIPGKVDSAIVFAPAGELVPPTLAKLDRGGTLACAGIHMTDIPVLNYQHHLFEERDLRSVTCNTREDGRGLMREAAEAGIVPEVQVFGLGGAVDALSQLKAGRVRGTAVLDVDA